MTTHPAPTLKEGYKLPESPVKVYPECVEPIKPVAYLDSGDGWSLGGWDCDNLCGEIQDDMESFEWPFDDDDYAKESDFEKLGFVCV